MECEPEVPDETTPSRLFLGTRCITVSAVLDHWPGQDSRYVKVRGDDRGLYSLRYDRMSDQWELTRSERPAGR